MSETQTINLARLIYNAYPSSDMLSLDPETDLESLEVLYNRVLDPAFEVGDTLFKFIVIELFETSQSGEEFDFEAALGALDTALDDLRAVSDALLLQMPS